ncbi:MAG: rhodanese-like domain-containing protein [Gemmatimonadaceae bacterium]
MRESLFAQKAVRAFGFSALGLAILAAFARTPDFNANTRVDVRSLARNVEKEEDHVTAVELAQWIKDRRPGLRVVDVRSAPDFDAYHIPTAERIDVSQLVDTPFRADETVVLYSDGGAHAAQGWVFLRALGYPHVYFLRGGLYEWLDNVINPTISGNPSDSSRTSWGKVESLSRYFGGVPRSGNVSKPAATEIPRVRRRGC